MEIRGAPGRFLTRIGRKGLEMDSFRRGLVRILLIRQVVLACGQRNG
ncbi:hypothetical protein Btus_0380 [Kyrpidia tusciae DSM 2912]|uniref:Uncharacterized protein n=1 Tax=Kyrpidia tusciae (strain DSM 2912 / NBRC 15312 / T2) TaxID=562970 RepID=D5WT46_KYRT2|nr:hypothetical protein Btus_0380 [Kyrpidia tusciae DSM 2912]